MQVNTDIAVLQPPPRRAGRALLAAALPGWAWLLAAPPQGVAHTALAACCGALTAAALLHRAGRSQRAAQTALAQRVAEQQAELKQLQMQMRQAQAAAEAADQAKTRFLAAASHDLRQPAHALGLYLAALRAHALAPAQAEIAERMAASLAALEALFAALLDVSRIDAGAVVPHWELLAPAPLLRRLADEWAPAAEARGLRLALHLAPEVADPAALTVSDALLLERIVRNLLSNAVKYTREGGVLLACRPRTAADGTRAWRIEVWDSGVGIAAADHERVFEEFAQVAAQAPGAGLGLAIVRRLAAVLQLRVSLHSRRGRGSVFCIEGLQPAGVGPQRAAVARRELRRLAGTVVAVIEDDADVRDALCRLLRLWECEVVAGADAAEVQRHAQAAALRADVVVADVHLAEGRLGPDEAQALLGAWGRSLPVLLVSADVAPARLRQWQAEGHACLAKPVSPAQLRAWLEAALQPAESAP